MWILGLKGLMQTMDSLEIMSMFLAQGNTEQDEMQTSSSDYFGIKRVADNVRSVLAPSTDSKKVNLANSDTLLSTVCCKRPFLYEG